jgi:hypothetical protein
MKRFFLARTMRERVLLTAFALLALGAWAPSVLGRLADWRTEWRSAMVNADAQQEWLGRRAEVEARAGAAAQALEPAKTLDAARAFAELNRMAAGLGAEVSAQRSDRADQFAVHTVQVNIRRADLAAVLKFYEQVAARAPYLGVEHCSISAERSTPGQINAVFRIYSIEAMPPTG